VIGKTGTTRLASSLSGFVRGRYVFAVVQNGSPVATFTARAAQDAFALALARAP
jgi:D-alanyl-D-alanine carboxypeptidase